MVKVQVSLREFNVDTGPKYMTYSTPERDYHSSLSSETEVILRVALPGDSKSLADFRALIQNATASGRLTLIDETVVNEVKEEKAIEKEAVDIVGKEYAGKEVW